MSLNDGINWHFRWMEAGWQPLLVTLEDFHPEPVSQWSSEALFLYLTTAGGCCITLQDVRQLLASRQGATSYNTHHLNQNWWARYTRRRRGMQVSVLAKSGFISLYKHIKYGNIAKILLNTWGLVFNWVQKQYRGKSLLITKQTGLCTPAQGRWWEDPWIQWATLLKPCYCWNYG